MIKRIVSVVAVAILAIGVAGCSGSNSDSIQVSGSTSVAPLMEKIKAAYTKDNKVEIAINPDGSSAGIKAADAKVSNIGMSSRVLSDDEKGLKLTDDVIALDAIAIIVNTDNKITNISLDQLKNIYAGKITNWKDLGGANQPITLVSRESGSGTKTAFEETLKLLNEDGSSKVDTLKPITANSSGAVLENVKTKPGSIGYISVESADKSVKVLSLDKVKPEEKTILDKTYKLSREFHLVYKEANDQTKKFLDYINSAEGKKVIKAAGFVPKN